MITSDVFLRRSLLAPIVVPILALSNVLNTYWNNSHKSLINADLASIGLNVDSFLVYSLILGGIPYLWMLADRRKEIQRNRGSRLRAIILQFPLGMLPYFLKFWGILGLVLLVSIVGAVYSIACVMFMIAGTVAVPVLGYIYIWVTFAFQSVFQWFGLVEKGTTL